MVKLRNVFVIFELIFLWPDKGLNGLNALEISYFKDRGKIEDDGEINGELEFPVIE